MEIEYKTKKELKDAVKRIIKEGSLIDKAKIYFYNEDHLNVFEGEEMLTYNELQELVNSETGDNKKLLESYIHLHYTVKDYGLRLNEESRVFQVTTALLHGGIMKYEAYEDIAKIITDVVMHAEEPYDVKENELIKKLSSGEARFCMDGTCAKLKIGGSSGLDLMLEDLKELNRMQLARVKAHIITIEENTTDKGLSWCQPLLVEDIIRRTKSNYFAHTLDDEKFFEETINERINKGETVTKDERAIAVYPDYNTVIPHEETLKKARAAFKKLLED